MVAEIATPLKRLAMTVLFSSSRGVEALSAIRRGDLVNVGEKYFFTLVIFMGSWGGGFC